VGSQVSLNPCTDTIIAAFAEAALNTAIGLPRGVYMDNGRDYTSYRFGGRGHRGKRWTPEEIAELVRKGERAQSLMGALGINVTSAIPENARAKVVERTFRIVSERFCKNLPTYCGGNSKDKPPGLGERLKQPDKYGMALGEFRELFNKWVGNVYNKTVSAGEGREGESPDETFTRTRLPVRAASMEAMRLFFMKSTNPFKIGRNGIAFRGKNYYSNKFSLIKGRPVFVRYREEDLSKIWVFKPDGEYLGEAFLRGRIPAIGASKEEIEAEMRLKAAERKAVMEHEVYKKAKAAKPMTINDVIELYQKYNDSAPDVEPTKVIEAAGLPKAGRDAARRMKATGTEGINIFEAVLANEFEKRKED
jgi:hypothetical protein